MVYCVEGPGWQDKQPNNNVLINSSKDEGVFRINKYNKFTFNFSEFFHQISTLNSL